MPTENTALVRALTEPDTSVIPPDELDDSTIKEIGKLIVEGNDPVRIGRVIGQPTSKVITILHAERHRLALLLLPWASKSMVKTASRAQAVLDAVLTTLEERVAEGTLTGLDLDQLIKLGKAMASLVTPVHQRLALGPLSKDSGDERAQPITMDKVNILIQQLHEANQVVSSREDSDPVEIP